MRKKLLAIILVLMMSSINVQYAYAEGLGALLEVSGGSFAAGGMSIETLASLGPYAIAIVTAACIACGVNVYITEESKQAGMTKTEFMEQQIKDWCQTAAISYGDFTDRILDGTTVSKDGTINLSADASKTISQFTEWAFDADKVQKLGDDFEVVFDDTSYPYSNNVSWNWQSSTIEVTTSEPVAFVIVGDYVYAFTKSSGVTYFSKIVGGSGYSGFINTLSNGYYYASIYYGYRISDSTLNIPTSDYTTIKSFLGSLEGTFTPQEAKPSNDTLTGDKASYDDEKGVYAPGVGQVTGLQPGIRDKLLNPPDGITYPTDGTIPLDGYLDGIIDLVNDLPVSIPVVNDITGVVDYPVIRDIPVDETITIDDVADPTIDDPNNPNPDPDPYTPILDFNTPYVPSSSDVGELTLDFHNVFPFCIPYDLVDMIRLLNASPVAPSYRIQWTIPMLDITLDYTIDLSPFDGVATIVRNMELLLFVFGLAVETRKIIRS